MQTLTVPKLVLAGRLPAHQNATVRAYLLHAVVFLSYVLLIYLFFYLGHTFLIKNQNSTTLNFFLYFFIFYLQFLSYVGFIYIFK